MLMSEGTGREWETLLKNRHPGTREKMLWFEYGHLTDPRLRTISMKFTTLAVELIETLHDGPQLTIALDKLREAKDRAVSQAITDGRLDE
jgi:hypothetical protein